MGGVRYLDKTYYRDFRVFIASPGDVKEERDLAKKAILEIDRNCRDTLGLSVECIRWEDMVPTTTSRPIEEVILENLRTCNVFVLILNKIYGTIEAGQDISNTEREVEEALSMKSAGKPIMVLTYFRDLPDNPDPGKQEKRLRSLRSRLDDKGLWYSRYKTPHDFKDQLTHHLYHQIMKFQASAKKVKALRAFWQLGGAQDDTLPKLGIFYPPVDRTFMKMDDPDTIWLQRLVPHIVFEDYKAIQKIDRTLQLIGFGDFKVCSTTSVRFPSDCRDMNRVWICLPRSQRGSRQISSYGSKVRFQFPQNGTRLQRYLLWRPAKSRAKPFMVESPLSKYLKEQRNRMPGGIWRPEYGQIIGKDYAVLARFSDTSRGMPNAYALKDYVFAGLRGLGTWGAGWYLENQYEKLREVAEPEDKPVQILLEVTFLNDAIDRVEDVSDKPESYFVRENRISTIRRNIQEYT